MGKWDRGEPSQHLSTPSLVVTERRRRLRAELTAPPPPVPTQLGIREDSKAVAFLGPLHEQVLLAAQTWRVGKMAQRLKGLPRKFEDHSSDP